MQTETGPQGTAGHLPSLAKPFAAFGAAAGLFAILAIGAFREPARWVSPIAPMVVTAVVGMAAGEVLQRWRRLHGPELAREAVVVWIAVVTGIAGAVSGGLIAFVTWGPAGVARFTVGGAAVGLAFAPSCLVIFDAARRASRARNGSLVAETDRRTVQSTVLAGIAFASAVQVPALLSAESSLALAPRTQLALSLVVSLGTTIAIVVLQRRDRKGRSVLEELSRNSAWLESAAAEETDPVPAAPGALDLGLGAERWARANDAHYRSSGRPDVVLRGSIADATAAFDEGTRRRHRSLLVAASGLTAVVACLALRISVYL